MVLDLLLEGFDEHLFILQLHLNLAAICKIFVGEGSLSLLQLAPVVQEGFELVLMPLLHLAYRLL